MDKYTKISNIGKGTFGAVYLVRNEQNKKYVCLISACFLFLHLIFVFLCSNYFPACLQFRDVQMKMIKSIINWEFSHVDEAQKKKWSELLLFIVQHSKNKAEVEILVQ